jgi:dihydrolipoamide dehydrogenase
MGREEHTQLLVIGAGPGGYAAAFMARRLGIEVTLADEEREPGGVCLYRGCIPSKALLHAAKIITEARDARAIGLKFAEPEIALDRLREWKDGVVTQLTHGLARLCELRKVRYVRGRVSFSNSSSVRIRGAGGEEKTLSFDHAIVASGSRPVALPFIPRSPRVLDSTSALELSDIPPRLLVVGGGYIGLELGTLYHALGSSVTVIEMSGSLLPGTDVDLSKVLHDRIKTMFVSVRLDTSVRRVEDTGSFLRVTMTNGEGKETVEETDRVLVAVGRRPDVSALGLDNTLVETDEKGFIKVDPQRRTADNRIFAVGDIAGPPMLAHKAMHEGRLAARVIAGRKDAFDTRAIPAVVFSNPEIAWCGLTEREARKMGREIRVVKFPWTASGRAGTLHRTEGLTKILLDRNSGRVLGVGIVGEGCGELIAEGVLAMEMGAVTLDIALTIHPHPTLSETIMEAAQAASGESISYHTPAREES